MQGLQLNVQPLLSTLRCTFSCWVQRWVPPSWLPWPMCSGAKDAHIQPMPEPSLQEMLDALMAPGGSFLEQPYVSGAV